MVISSTRATEASIQAVSPLLSTKAVAVETTGAAATGATVELQAAAPGAATATSANAAVRHPPKRNIFSSLFCHSAARL